MKKRILTLAAAVASLAITAQGAYAYNSYLNSVNNSCGTSYGCGLCHIDPNGGGTLTTDGTNFKNSGYDPTYFCSSPPTPACIDADGDGYFAEPGCGTPVDCDDSDPSVYPGALEVCNDGKDNDCDGLVDCNDTDCAQASVCAPPPVCNDADGDGYFAEPGCGTSVDCDDSDPSVNPGALEVCDDGIDNDCNGLIDCADGRCSSNPVCAPSVTPEICDDGIDNDGDGSVDCADRDCRRDPACTETGSGSEGRGKTCSDGIDNDGDGLIDCDDPDCFRNRTCASSRGGNGGGHHDYNDDESDYEGHSWESDSWDD